MKSPPLPGAPWLSFGNALPTLLVRSDFALAVCLRCSDSALRGPPGLSENPLALSGGIPSTPHRLSLGPLQPPFRTSCQACSQVCISGCLQITTSGRDRVCCFCCSAFCATRSSWINAFQASSSTGPSEIPVLVFSLCCSAVLMRPLRPPYSPVHPPQCILL